VFGEECLIGESVLHIKLNRFMHRLFSDNILKMLNNSVYCRFFINFMIIVCG
jgi:hypothetical protein